MKKENFINIYKESLALELVRLSAPLSDVSVLKAGSMKPIRHYTYIKETLPKIMSKEKVKDIMKILLSHMLIQDYELYNAVEKDLRRL